MVIERRLGLVEAIRKGAGIIPAIKGQAWIPLDSFSITTKFDEAVSWGMGEATPFPVRLRVITRTLKPIDEHHLREDKVIVDLGISSVDSLEPADVSERILERDQINDPSEPWHGTISWREDSEKERQNQKPQAEIASI